MTHTQCLHYVLFLMYIYLYAWVYIAERFVKIIIYIYYIIYTHLYLLISIDNVVDALNV